MLKTEKLLEYFCDFFCQWHLAWRQLDFYRMGLYARYLSDC